MVTFRFDEIPPGFSTPGIAFDFLGKFRAVLDDRFLRAVGCIVDQRVPVFILVPGKPGEAARRIFMNEGFKDAVARRNKNEVIKQLIDAIEVGVNTPKEKVILGDAKRQLGIDGEGAG